MFAVIKTGGKQYRVAGGDTITVEKLEGAAGDKVTFGDVLMTGEGDKLKLGSALKGLTVTGEIVEQTRAEKITIIKKKRRNTYRRKQGHRQHQTVVRIADIGAK